MFFLYFPLSSCLVGNASSTNISSLIALHCSCACKEFNNCAKVILDKSLVFSNVVMVALNLLGIITKIFPIKRDSLNVVPNNLILFVMLKSLSEYSLMFSDSFIFCNSKSPIRFSTCMPLLLSSPSYSWMNNHLGRWKMMVLRTCVDNYNLCLLSIKVDNN